MAAEKKGNPMREMRIAKLVLNVSKPIGTRLELIILTVE